MSAAYDRMTPDQRLTAVSIDISREPMFAHLSGVACVGSVKLDDAVGTACTDGADEIYSPEFVMLQSRKQMRYVKIHETLHKALRHCTDYMGIMKREPQAAAIAMDYEINGLIESIDPNYTFIARPTSHPPLVHPKYFGWSFIRILKDILANSLPQPQSQPQQGNGHQGEGQGSAGSKVFIDPDGNEIDRDFDEHQAAQPDKDKLQELKRQIDDALHQGQILQERLRGTGAGNKVLSNVFTKRDTNWRQHLRQFLTEISEGDEQSRFSPPNKRLMPAGYILPSHFSEASGEIIIAADTSGSMGGVYPLLFGEVARICEHVRPDSVRVLWWDSAVAGDQQFKPQDYDKIAKILKPAGGGGTTVSCVANYIKEKQYKPKAVIYLTDGYIESEYIMPTSPVLWGVVDNDNFVGKKGKTIRIYS